MNITPLAVVNACLASMGEEPINSLAEDNAFVNSAKFALEQANINEQSRGWYFNIEKLWLEPNQQDSQYYVPADVMDLTVKGFNPGWASLRGRRLYNNDEAEIVTGTQRIRVEVIRLLRFEDLPIMAQRMVKAATVMLFNQSYDGDSVKISEAQTEYQMAYTYTNAQHIKSVQANFLPNRGARPSRRLPTHG